MSTTLRNFHVILHHATEFRPNRSTHCRNMMSFPFFKMAAATAKYQFRFCICWCHCLQEVKVYQQTKFCRHISIDGWDITTSVSEKQTSAVLEIYFRFRSGPVRLNLHIILHQATEFSRNRSIHCGNMTSYPFLKMPAATAKYYFRFRICWCHCLQKVKVYLQTKFCRHISIDGWDITTRYNFAVIGVSFCIWLPNFVQIGTSAAGIWRHIYFQDGGRQPCCYCFGVMADHPRGAFRGLNSVLKPLLRRIKSSGDIAM